MSAGEIAKRIIDGIEPEVTTEEVKLLASEYARIQAQRSAAEGDIPSPPADREALREAIENLRNWVGHCPDCDGAGETIDSHEAYVQCQFCKPARELIERHTPPEPEKTQHAPAEFDDDISF